MIPTTTSSAAAKSPGSGEHLVAVPDPESYKYSTYSQSEVDRLLKIQAENISTNFIAKIKSQQKFVQNAITKNEVAMRKASAELYTDMAQFNKEAASAAEAHTEKLKTLMEKTQNEMDVQFEQVKADLDRTLMNDLKSFDKRLQHLDAMVTEISQSRQSANSQTLTILVALSIVISLANVVMLFIHH